MGQSVLRDGRAPFRRDGRWPPLPSADRKGVGFRSPNPEWRRWAPRGVQCGNATDPGEAGGSPGESSLFFVKGRAPWKDRKSTRLNSSHTVISYAVFCLKKKKKKKLNKIKKY